MTYYANIVNGVVAQVIVADIDVVAQLDGLWAETRMDDPMHRYAGIGDGWTGMEFVPRPFDQSTWDVENNIWVTPAALGIVSDASPIITADGVDFVLIYIISAANTIETIFINGDQLALSTDANGYAEFELSSDTAGLLVIAWGNFTLEVAAV